MSTPQYQSSGGTALAGQAALVTGGGSGIGLACAAARESSWITGEAIGVDGGHHLRRGPDVEHWSRALFGDDATESRV
jgi:hypothetical protein